MAAFPRVKSEVVSAETDMDTYFTPESVEKGRFYDHHEGALIRVYWASGAWQVSTQKKIDAFRSRWGSSQSYGDLWAKAVDEVVDQVSGEDKENVDPGSELPRNPLLTLFKRLNQKKQYLFLVRNNADNRLEGSRLCRNGHTQTASPLRAKQVRELPLRTGLALQGADDQQAEHYGEHGCCRQF